MFTWKTSQPFASNLCIPIYCGHAQYNEGRKKSREFPRQRKVLWTKPESEKKFEDDPS